MAGCHRAPDCMDGIPSLRLRGRDTIPPYNIAYLSGTAWVEWATWLADQMRITRRSSHRPREG
jgi:hypothetical protein